MRLPPMIAAALSVAGPTLAQTAAEDPTPALLEAMEGTWTVSQRSWDGPGAEPTELPSAVARREVAAGGGFLEEAMTLAGGAAGDPFARSALLNLDPTGSRFGHVPLDSRAPRRMVHQSPTAGPDEHGPLALQGGLFVAPAWGHARNVPFACRLEVGPVEGGRQVVSLYLTPQGEGDQREFLAFEYVYTQRP